MPKVTETDEAIINEALALLCGWQKGYVRRRGDWWVAGGFLVPATEDEYGAVEGWVKRDDPDSEPKVRINCPNYMDGSRTEELLVALGREQKFRVQILTHPHIAEVALVKKRGTAFSWDRFAIHAADNPGRALALSAYVALTKLTKLEYADSQEAAPDPTTSKE